MTNRNVTKQRRTGIVLLPCSCSMYAIVRLIYSFVARSITFQRIATPMTESCNAAALISQFEHSNTHEECTCHHLCQDCIALQPSRLASLQHSFSPHWRDQNSDYCRVRCASLYLFTTQLQYNTIIAFQ